MFDFLSSKEDIFIFIYCIILLWNNIDYLRDYKKIKEELDQISSDSELDINPNSISVILFSLLFRFFRSWLFYILAVLLTQNILVLIVAVVLFIIDLYQALFKSSVEDVKKSKVRKYQTIAETVFISGFVIYYFWVM
ncbi:hypothetical protein [Bacillus alkalicellulosilyticus]|uniref:hypothetical protein n=1 Tax=Alkalihalobacterium alkalicellulosilyticum TaxID=1912214 RepID=UPI000995F0EB|nr:hypothetical protein [Bacillus alkalicellulosilyticus]